MDRTFAEAFAHEWIEAWNSHDLERIFSHYTDDFEMTSPYIVERMNEPSGTLRGKAAIRPYWEKALAMAPPLHFEFEQVLVGVASITILYRRSVTAIRAAEVLFFDGQGRVVRGVAHYG
jgi:ketosteroid isomerase-like protein